MIGNSIQYAVVGLGRSGWGIHVAQLRERTDAKIVAVADPLEARRQQAQDELGCLAYESLDELLGQKEVDVMVITTPSTVHTSDAIKALAVGYHVVVEKPMALNVTDAETMIQSAKHTGKYLFVHQQHRFKRSFRHIEEVIASGILGKIYHIRNYISGFRRRNDWQTLVKNGGGELNNTGVHYLDQIVQLVGSPFVQAMADLRCIASAGDAEDHVKAFLRAGNGCTVDMEISNAQALPSDLPLWIVCGTCGTLTSDGSETIVKWFDPDAAPRIEVVDGPVMHRSYDFGDVLPWQEEVVSVEGGSPSQEFYDNVTAVLHGGEPMQVTPESVIQTMRVLEMIRQASLQEAK